MNAFSAHIIYLKEFLYNAKDTKTHSIFINLNTNQRDVNILKIIRKMAPKTFDRRAQREEKKTARKKPQNICLYVYVSILFFCLAIGTKSVLEMQSNLILLLECIKHEMQVK